MSSKEETHHSSTCPSLTWPEGQCSLNYDLDSSLLGNSIKGALVSQDDQTGLGDVLKELTNVGGGV